MANQYPRHGTSWTAADIALLTKIAAEGGGMGEAVALLGRKPDAIRQKGLEFGISLGRARFRS